MQYELLAPAGGMEQLETALRYGADAIYLGGNMLQLRAAHTGFSMDALSHAAAYAHARGRKVYVTVNAFANNDEIDHLPEYAQSLYACGADAAIVADAGVLCTMMRAEPRLDIHVSTQANCVNYAAAALYADLGAKRVVLGREMTLDEIVTLRQKTPASLELEAFVHGAMCMAYSGRCMISAYLAGRSANRGACTQSCRWSYHLVEQKRPNQFFPVEESERGMTLLSSYDLNALAFLDQLMAAGVTSFKIEGRMKTPYYVATVVNAYRKRIDGLLGRAQTATDELARELDAISHRPYSSGFYFGELRHHEGDEGAYLQDCTFVGVVRALLPDGRIGVELRNRIREGEALEVLSPRALGMRFVAREIRDAQGNAVPLAVRPSERYTMQCPLSLEVGDMLRIRDGGTKA